MRRIETECDALLIGSTAMKMWFPHFRSPKDADLYVKPEFVDRFIKANPDINIRDRTNRKLYGFIGNRTIDFTIDKRGSWIGHIMHANRAGKRIAFHSTTVTLATPTSLRLIKEVLSCWRKDWRKNISDYIFLSTIVDTNYSDDERKAIEVGMRNFNKYYPDKGVPIDIYGKRTLDYLEGVVNIADLKSRIMVKDNILEYL